MSDPFDWNQFSDYFKKQFSGFNPGLPGKRFDLSWLDQYIQETINNATPNANTNNKQPRASLSSEIIDIHKYLIAKVQIPNDMNEKLIRVWVSPHRLKLSGLPGRNTHEIDLPVSVDSHESKAIFKARTLEIRMPKKDQEEPFTDIDVHYL